MDIQIRSILVRLMALAIMIGILAPQVQLIAGNYDGLDLLVEIEKNQEEEESRNSESEKELEDKEVQDQDSLDEGALITIQLTKGAIHSDSWASPLLELHSPPPEV